MQHYGEITTGKLKYSHHYIIHQFFLNLEERNHMTRTYPSGSRVDSSNAKPLVAWATGEEVVIFIFSMLLLNTNFILISRLSVGCT